MRIFFSPTVLDSSKTIFYDLVDVTLKLKGNHTIFSSFFLLKRTHFFTFLTAVHLALCLRKTLLTPRGDYLLSYVVLLLVRVGSYLFPLLR